MNRRAAPIAAVTSAALLCVAMSPAPGSARADVVAYLVNVTVRPGYSFANADAAMAYGQGICGEVAQAVRTPMCWAASNPTSTTPTIIRRRIS
jgi:hypothetical protein